MRHVFTVEVIVESDDTDRGLIIDSILESLTDIQDQAYCSAEIMPDGTETGQRGCVLSVVSAQSEGLEFTAGWAA
jgi:hypothetical protein